jgi:hypothetical protein
VSINGMLYCAGAFPDQTLADDIRGEDDHPPSHTIQVPAKGPNSAGLDESAIKDWWAKFRTAGVTEWCTLGTNCSTIAAYARTRGGGAEFSDMWSSSNAIWTPNAVLSYARALRDGIKYANLRPAQPSRRDLDGGLPPGGV